MSQTLRLPGKATHLQTGRETACGLVGASFLSDDPNKVDCFKCLKTRAFLRRRNTMLTNALEACKEMIDTALPQFNWGASSLSADAIRLLNETPAKVTAALRR